MSAAMEEILLDLVIPGTIGEQRRKRMDHGLKSQYLGHCNVVGDTWDVGLSSAPRFESLDTMGDWVTVHKTRDICPS